jgi:hypothetical protein
MATAAKILGYLLLTVGTLLAVALLLLWLQGERASLLGTAALALAFGIPGGLFISWAAVAERRAKAAQLVQKSERFTIDQVALLLESSPEVAHAFIAGQIAKHGLQLTYQPDTKGYAKRALPAPSTPCPSCGVAVAPTETGFCPSCGARRAGG